MVSGLNLPPQTCQSVNFGRKKEAKQPEQPVDVIEQAYKITNDFSEPQKFFSPFFDVAMPLMFAVPSAYSKTDHNLSKILKKLNKAKAGGNAKKIAEFQEKYNATKKLIGDGKVHINSVTSPKAAFNTYYGRFTLLSQLAMEGWETIKTAKQLGTKAALKQACRGTVKAVGETFGWVAGSVVGHKVAAKVGSAIGTMIAGPAGRFIGNLIGSTIGFIGGAYGQKIMGRLGEKVYGKSELEQAKDAQYKQDLKNIDLNDKTTLKQQIVKNQTWLMQYADESGNISLTGNKKVDEKIEIVAKSSEELMNKFRAVGGTDAELQAAFDNPDELFAQKPTTKNDSATMYYSGAFNSATAQGDPRFNGYNQRVFA